MILRRITSALKRQDWFTVGIETLIVVLGVFLGIQLGNWNEDRKDRADEQVYIQRLHDDVVDAEARSARLRERRFGQRDGIVSGLDVLFGRTDRKELTDDECVNIAYSQDYVLTAPELPAFNELLNSGQLGIIRDDELVSDLAGFRQALEVLEYWRSWGTRDQHALPDKFPDLIQIESYFDDERGEVHVRATCDEDAMRANPHFLNNLSENADTYDGFVRDALTPWNDQLSKLHGRLDQLLAIDHEATP